MLRGRGRREDTRNNRRILCHPPQGRSLGYLINGARAKTEAKKSCLREKLSRQIFGLSNLPTVQAFSFMFHFNYNPLFDFNSRSASRFAVFFFILLVSSKRKANHASCPLLASGVMNLIG